MRGGYGANSACHPPGVRGRQAVTWVASPHLWERREPACDDVPIISRPRGWICVGTPSSGHDQGCSAFAPGAVRDKARERSRCPAHASVTGHVPPRQSERGSPVTMPADRTVAERSSAAVVAETAGRDAGNEDGRGVLSRHRQGGDYGTESCKTRPQKHLRPVRPRLAAPRGSPRGIFLKSDKRICYKLVWFASVLTLR